MLAGDYGEGAQRIASVEAAFARIFDLPIWILMSDVNNPLM
jgi:hypothetical protein